MMNWNIFFFVLSLGLATALLSLREQLTAVEARMLAITRVGAAAVLSFIVPEQLTPVAFVALAVWELSLVIARLLVAVHVRMLETREAKTWLVLYRQAEIARSNMQKAP